MKEVQSKPFFRSSIFYWIILLLVVSILGGFFYWQLGRDVAMVDLKSSVNVGGDGLPDGVEVVEMGGGRVLRNEREKYTVELSDEMNVVGGLGNDVIVNDYAKPNEAYGGLPGCETVLSVSEKSIQGIAKVAAQECESNSDCTNYSITQKRFNDVDWFEIIFSGNYVGSGNPEYRTEKDNKIYSVYFKCSDIGYVNSIMKNFSFID